MKERIPWWKRLVVAASVGLAILAALELVWNGVLPHNLLGFCVQLVIVFAVPTLVALIVRMPRAWWRLGG